METITEQESESKIFLVIQDPAAQEPKFDYQAALYFLDGHYLFRVKTGEGWASKFVTSVDVAAAFLGAEVDTGWLPAGVVRAGASAKGKWFVYSTPAQKIKITFDGEDTQLTIPLPRLVLLGVGSDYYLWAQHSKHFDLDEKAYNAPFPNVHPGGHICWGANTPKSADPANARQSWELFFSTPFNRDLVNDKSKAFPKDARAQLRALDGKNTYPVDDLVACRTSIKYTIDQALGVR